MDDVGSVDKKKDEADVPAKLSWASYSIPTRITHNPKDCDFAKRSSSRTDTTLIENEIGGQLMLAFFGTGTTLVNDVEMSKDLQSIHLFWKALGFIRVMCELEPIPGTLWVRRNKSIEWEFVRCHLLCEPLHCVSSNVCIHIQVCDLLPSVPCNSYKLKPRTAE